MKKTIATLSVIAAFMGSAAFAEDLNRSLNVFEIIEKTDDTGATVVERIEPTDVLPNDKLVYVVTFENSGDAEIGDVKTIANIDPSTILDVTSISAEGVAVDFATTQNPAAYDKLEALRVTDENGVEREAKAEDLSNIRFIIEKIGSKETKVIEFVASVK